MNTEEIQEMLAEHENRISLLENSLPGSAMSYHPEESQEEIKAIPEKPWNRKQWDIVNQLRGEMANLKRKFLDLERGIQRKGKY